jgi:hypothetical protein
MAEIKRIVESFERGGTDVPDRPSEAVREDK